MKGLPPLLIQCGDAELLRDEVTLLAHKASLAGVAVRHELYEDCVHVFQAFLFLDASRKALQSARHFVRTALDKRGRRKSTHPSSSSGQKSNSTGDSLVGDASRDKMDKEMKSEMRNSEGQIVETRTGEKKNDRGRTNRDGSVKAESDDENGEVDSRDEEQWELYLEENLNAQTVGKSEGLERFESLQISKDGDRPSSSEMSRSATQPSLSTLSTPSVRQEQDSGIQSSSSSSTRPHRRSLTNSLTTTSLEEARSRASAGMRAQHGGQAPHLGKFHAPTKDLRPRIRSRNASQSSNVALDDLMQSYQKDHSGLHTQVWTPDT